MAKETTPDLAQRVDELEARVNEMVEMLDGIVDHNNRHKGGPTPRVFSEAEIKELEEAIKTAKRNAAPPRASIK